MNTCSWQEYAAYLHAFEGYTPQEAIKKAKLEYKKQYGKTPDQHIAEINAIWNCEAFWKGLKTQ